MDQGAQIVRGVVQGHAHTGLSRARGPGPVLDALELSPPEVGEKYVLIDVAVCLDEGLLLQLLKSLSIS